MLDPPAPSPHLHRERGVVWISTPWAGKSVCGPMKKKNDKGRARPTDRPKRDAYIGRASSKKNWIEKAEDLLSAASFLKPEVEKLYRSWKKRFGISSELPDGQPTDTPIATRSRKTGWQKCRHRIARASSGKATSPTSRPSRGGFIRPLLSMPVRGAASHTIAGETCSLS